MRNYVAGMLYLLVGMGVALEADHHSGRQKFSTESALRIAIWPTFATVAAMRSMRESWE